MIFLYTEDILDVDLNQVVPTCEIYDRRVVPLVGEDMQCIRNVIYKTSQGLAVKTRNKLLAAFLRELRPDLTIYIWGAPMRAKNIVPIYSGNYRGPGIYYVKTTQELKSLWGKPVDGVMLDVRGFNPYLLELVVKNKVHCCKDCHIVEKLACNAYREVEIL
ncbi:MAG: hypothetical protein ACK4SY_01180 [Pyrobaculum sp.]